MNLRDADYCSFLYKLELGCWLGIPGFNRKAD